jgi:hypothetical protein
MAEGEDETRRCRVRTEPGRLVVSLDGQDRLVVPLVVELRRSIVTSFDEIAPAFRSQIELDARLLADELGVGET